MKNFSTEDSNEMYKLLKALIAKGAFFHSAIELEHNFNGEVFGEMVTNLINDIDKEK